MVHINNINDNNKSVSNFNSNDDKERQKGFFSNKTKKKIKKTLEQWKLFKVISMKMQINWGQG